MRHPPGFWHSPLSYLSQIMKLVSRAEFQCGQLSLPPVVSLLHGLLWQSWVRSSNSLISNAYLGSGWLITCLDNFFGPSITRGNLIYLHHIGSTLQVNLIQSFSIQFLSYKLYLQSTESYLKFICITKLYQVIKQVTSKLDYLDSTSN